MLVNLSEMYPGQMLPVRAIALSGFRGRHVIVDPEDREAVRGHWWALSGNGRQRYYYVAARRNGRRTCLARLITGYAMVGYVNGDPLDCRRVNLVEIDPGLRWLAVPPRPGGTSRYKGVSWAAGQRRWRVNVRWRGKPREIGCFRDEDEAARAYDAAVLALVPAALHPYVLTNARLGLFGEPSAQRHDTSSPARPADLAARQRIAGNLSRLRRERGWTQADVGRRLGYTSGVYISYLESGARYPGPGLRSRLAEVYGITEGELTG